MLSKIRYGVLFLTILTATSLLYPDVAHCENTPQNLELAGIQELLDAHPELVLNVLRQHPLELIDILEQAVAAKREADLRRLKQADLSVKRNPVVSENRPIRGNPEATVTIVEYSDFQCPYCSQATETVKRLMAMDRSGELRLVFKHLPLNPVSHELALAFEAVALQSHDAAWILHDQLFERQDRLRGNAEAVLQEIVAALELDLERFAEDRRRPELAELIRADMEEARQFGLSGTPMFLVNGIPVRGAVPLSEFQRIIELARTRLHAETAGQNQE